MISQLTSNRFEDAESDPFSFMGKIALAAGSGYGLFKTIKEGLPNMTTPFSSAYKNRLSKTLGIGTAGIDKVVPTVQFTRLGDIVSSKARPIGVSFNTALSSLSQATAGSKYQTSFLNQFQGLVQDIESRGYRNLNYGEIRAGNQLLELHVSPKEGTRFTIRPVNAEGDIYLGTGQPIRQSARLTMNADTGEISDISTAILKEQRLRLGEILPKASDIGAKPILRAKDIEKVGLDTSIFEDIAQGKSFAGSEFLQAGVSALRKQEVLVDPFKKLAAFPGAQDAQFATFKRAVMEGFLAPGSASMTSKGIGFLPESLLSQVPGADLSTTGKQFFRPSKFLIGGKTSSLALPGDELKQFKLGIINPKDLADFQKAARDRGITRFDFGELAEEELLMGKNSNITIGNQIYQYEIGLHDKTQQVSEEFNKVLDALAEQKQMSRIQLIKAMEQPGGLQNLDIKATGLSLGLSNEPIAGERKTIRVMNELDQRIASLMITDKGTLKVAVKTQYQMDQFQKVFGGFKGTVKAKTDVPLLLANLEFFKLNKRVGTLNEIKGLSTKFHDIDFITSKHPFGDFLGGKGLAPKEGAAFLQHNLMRATESGEYGAELLKGMGFAFENNQWKNMEGLAGTQLMERFQQLGGLESGLLKSSTGGIETVHTLLAPEFHRLQMGAGGRAGLSQRAFLNIMSYMPGEISEQLASRIRYPLGVRPQEQMSELLRYQSLSNEKAVERISLKDIAAMRQDIDKGVLHPDLQARAGALELAGMKKGSKFATIDLGQEVIPEGGGPSFRNITISADERLGAFIGAKPGTGGAALSDLDKATAAVLDAALKKDTATLNRVGAEYQKTLSGAIGSVQENLFRGRFTGSLYGQAQSSLPGLEKAAAEFPGTPIIGLSARDIVKQARDLGMPGKKALQMAQAGDLWSLVSREPAEGLLRTVPAKVMIADTFGASHKSKGIVHVANQVAFRKALGVDFDADQLSTILFTDDKARQTFEKFTAQGSDEVGAIGREFFKTQSFFETLRLKGESNIDLLDPEGRGVLKEFQLEAGKTEKKLIGPLSTALEEVHAGFRESLLADRTTQNIATAMKGEAFALFLAESSIKAKHRTPEALRHSEEILGILRKRDTKGLQTFMDRMAFRQMEIGSEIRAAETISPQLAERAGGAEFAKTYKEITSDSVMESFFKAKERGRVLREQGVAQEVLGGKAGLFSRTKNIIGGLESEISPFLRKGLKNVGLFGILPAAGIGLAATVLTSPKTLPIQMSAKEHDRSTPETDIIKTPSPVWIQPKKERYRLSGKVSNVPSLNELSSYSGSGNANVNLSDNRTHLSQDYIDRKISRGF